MIKGSCCCQAVQFELSTPPQMMGTCHCSRCRKLGASCIVFVERQSFRLLQGQDDIATYHPDAPFHYQRNFCKQCGTALGEISSDSASFPIPSNCLDDELSIHN